MRSMTLMETRVDVRCKPILDGTEARIVLCEINIQPQLYFCLKSLRTLPGKQLWLYRIQARNLSVHKIRQPYGTKPNPDAVATGTSPLLDYLVGCRVDS